MCGIIGYVGDKNAAPVLLEGLRTLEYRGYDSAGMYIPAAGVHKSLGPIENLAALLAEQPSFSGLSGIAHTRWATHGVPSEINAHPHSSADGNLWIVHNGIIENYQELKADLAAAGVSCASQTDTEVLALLIGQCYQGDVAQAVRTALLQVRGAYGLAVMHEDHPEQIVVTRLGSPIVIGVGDTAHYVASDPSALLAHTKRVVYLEDGELAVVTATTCQVATLAGAAKSTTVELLEQEVADVQKNGYEHFMLKEIMEGPQVVRDTLRGRLGAHGVKLGGLESIQSELAQLQRLTITACGSAYLAGYVGKYALETYARLPVEIAFASEYRYQTNLPAAHEAVLAITQSGETADTLAALREARELGLLTLGVVNVVGSSIARETDAGVYNHIGPEIAVASTKAFISELVVVLLIAIVLGAEREADTTELAAIQTALAALPDQIEKLLQDTESIQAVAKKYAKYEHAMYIGRNAHMPIAYEGALKLKEVTYIHAEAYAAGELKHGPIALLDERFPVIALAPQDATYEKMISNIEEVKARQAPVLAIATEGDTAITAIADDVLFVPKTHAAVQPILSVIPLHLLAYYIGVEKGLNVDRPRNLAKSVTVE